MVGAESGQSVFEPQLQRGQMGRGLARIQARVAVDACLGVNVVVAVGRGSNSTSRHCERKMQQGC